MFDQNYAKSNMVGQGLAKSRCDDEGESLADESVPFDSIPNI